MKNNKGFMLAEAVITSTIVLTTLIGLYRTFSRLYNLYNIRTTYSDIDGVYAIKGMIDNLIDNNIDNLIDNNKMNSTLQQVNTNNYSQLISKKVCNSANTNTNYCNSLQKLYNIENMYIIKYNKDAVINLKNQDINQTFKDYLDYISNYYSFVDSNADDTTDNKVNVDDGYKYLFVVEYKNGEDYYYSSLGLG